MELDTQMSTPPTLSEIEVLQAKLRGLEIEHRDLDLAIKALETGHGPDQFTLQRMKRQKLRLKDEIARLEDQITPDIIA